MTRSKNFLRKLPTADKETVLVVVSIKKIVYIVTKIYNLLRLSFLDQAEHLAKQVLSGFIFQSLAGFSPY